MSKSFFKMKSGFAAVLGALASAPATATDVALAGVFPGKALIVVNGGAPRAFAVGASSPDGVRVVGVDGDSATLEFDGGRHRLFVGQQAVHVSAAGAGGKSPSVILQADGHGQFYATGAINGAQVRYIVDTGATLVSIGRSDALKAGIDYTKGEPVTMQTANGTARAWRVVLTTVRVGDVTLRNVDAVVNAGELPFVLLGMSFLNRMEMRRDGPTLQLRQRY